MRKKTHIGASFFFAIVICFTGCSLQEKIQEKIPQLTPNKTEKEGVQESTLLQEEVQKEKKVPQKKKGTGQKKKYDQEYSNLLTQKGLILMREKKYAESIKIFQKALQEHPENQEAKKSLRMAGTFLKTQRNGFDPKYSEILTDKAVVLMQKNDLERALELFNLAIDNDPKNTVAHQKRKGLITQLQKKELHQKKKEVKAPVLVKSEEEVLEVHLSAPRVPQDVSDEAETKNITKKTKEEKPDANLFSKSNCIPTSLSTEKISQNFYEGIELSETLPTQFRTGEIVHLNGKITSSQKHKDIIAFMSPSDDPEKQSVFSGSIDKGAFEIPIYLPDEGEYVLSLLLGKKGTAKAYPISVKSPLCEEKIEKQSTSTKSITTGVLNGMGKFSWEDSENNLFRVEFTQDKHKKIFYLRNTNHFIPPVSAFSEFSKGDVTMSIFSSIAKGNSLTRTTDWIPGSKTIFTAVEHVSRYGNTLSDVILTDSFTLGETLSIKGTTALPLHQEIIVIDPDENFKKVNLDITGGKFHGKFTPTKSGVHIFELNQADKLSLFIGASVPRGTIPLLPSYEDLHPKQKTESLSLDKMPSKMLKLVNQERLKRGLSLLEYQENLENLAQFRADDMCTKNYMAHVNPEGKSAGDYMKQFAVQTSIGENIGQSKNTEAIHYGLMSSAAHRELIIKPENTRVGFGFCWDTKEKEVLTAVQIFGK